MFIHAKNKQAARSTKKGDMSSNLFQIQDVFGNDVCLPDVRCILVIHPEVQSFLIEIEDAIRNLHCVYTSPNDPHARLFYKRGITQGKYRNLYIKVVVSYETCPAIVKTAFFTASLTGDILLWIQKL